MEDDRAAALEGQLGQAKGIAEEADKKYEEVSRQTRGDDATPRFTNNVEKASHYSEWWVEKKRWFIPRWREDDA